MRVVVRAGAALDVFVTEPLPAGNERAVAGFIENLHLCLTGPEQLGCLNPTSSNGGS